MSEEERQAIIHLLDKQARYEYCIKNNISFSDEDYEAYIIRQSMINKDKEIERLNNIINDLLDRQNEALRYIENHLSLDSRYKHGNGDKELMLVRNILNKHIKELKGSDKE